MKKVLAVIAAMSVGMATCLTGCMGGDDGQALEEIDKTYSNGEITDTGYVNTFFGIQYTTPSGWNNKSQQSVDAAGSVSSNSSSKLVMYASTTDNSESVDMYITDLNTDTGKYTQDSFIDESIDNLKKSYESKGYQNVDVSKHNMIFCGEEIPAIKISYENDGKKVYQADVILLKGSYYGCITATSFNADRCSEILSSYSKLP